MNYLDIPDRVKQHIKRGETFYIGVELYSFKTDDIFWHPEDAFFRMSDSNFTYLENEYKARLVGIPELTKFIGKDFNALSLEVGNVKRGSESGSHLVFNYLIRGFRVGVRLIFPDLPIEESYLIWWGRVDHTEDLDEQSVKIICSQEIGDFAYELADEKYGSGCILHFGVGDCVGYEQIVEKSALYQQALSQFGQGGCNRTFERCNQFSYTDAEGNLRDQTRFYQGQRQIAVTDYFYKEEIIKKKFLFFTIGKKIKRTPIQWSSKNQSENDGAAQGRIYGRCKVVGHAITWADIGSQIVALIGFGRGEVEGFYQITSNNEKLTIASVTQHKGELGGIGSQLKPQIFSQSGYNSRIAYLEVKLIGSEESETADELPTISSIVKGEIVDVPFYDAQGNLNYRREWSHNPVWIIRHILLNSWTYQIIRPEWFDEEYNIVTANRCYEVVEDDTSAEVATVTAQEAESFIQDKWQRYTSAARYNASIYKYQNGVETNFVSRSASLFGQNAVNLLRPPYIDPADMEWFGFYETPILQNPRTYLAFRHTLNLLVAETETLSDVLWSWSFPSFRGFFTFTHRGKLGLGMRKPIDNCFVRFDSEVVENEIAVTNVRKFVDTRGYLLIGIGKQTCEPAKMKGIRYVNAVANTVTKITTSGSLNVSCPDRFQDRTSAPAELRIELEGAPTIGECLKVSFKDGEDELLWDYYVDDEDLNVVVQMLKTRLMASPAFREFWTAEVFASHPHTLVIQAQTGYILLEEALKFEHFGGEEILRVVEIYDDYKDVEHVNQNENSRPDGKDNIKDFVLNGSGQENFHGAKAVYISAVDDFAEKEIQPRMVWDAIEQERSKKLIDLDLRGVDNYRQAAWLVKSAAIDFIDGNLPCKFVTGVGGTLHSEGECVAIRHQIMEGISYTPFTVEAISYDHSAQATSLGLKLYLSAAFDDRVAKVEKFLDATLTPNENYQVTPPPVLAEGGYSKTRTGDGAGDRENNIKYETYKYENIPHQQLYSPEGRDKL